jgi:integrase/recombinase XerC
MQRELFLKYLKFEKRYSEHTIRAYIDDIDQFYAYNQTINPDFETTKAPEYRKIREWIVKLNKSGNSPKTINRKLSALKKYCKFLIMNHYISNNPFDKIISPKNPKQLPSFLNNTEIDQLGQIAEFQDSTTGKRDQAVVELLYCTGIRLSELINLKSTDIDFGRNTIKVLGKRNKERIIPYPESLKTILKEYENERVKTESPYFFTTIKGEKIYPRLVQRIVKKYLGLVSTNEKKNPHLLRHTFATHLLNNGAEINAIKELLGHANLSATQIYTHNTFQKLNKIYKQAHPRA